MEPKLSLIIPIYKTAQYLPFCLESILSQSRKDIEIILVDDGSPDDSPRICDEYASKYPTIRVLHKKNEGLSCARNSGLSQAKGEYVWFIDSDDYLLQDAIDNVYKTIKENCQVDVLSSGLLRFFEDKQTFVQERIPYGKLFEKRGEYLWKGCPQGASTRFICKRKFLLENKLLYQPGLLHEDGEWGYRMLYMANKVKILPTQVYVYRIRSSGSIMSDVKIKSAYDLVKGHKLLVEFMNKNVAKKDKKKYIQSIWGMIHAIDIFCFPLFNTPDFKIFLTKCYPYIQQEARKMIKSNPFRIKSYIYLIHPYVRMRAYKFLGRI